MSRGPVYEQTAWVLEFRPPGKRRAIRLWVPPDPEPGYATHLAQAELYITRRDARVARHALLCGYRWPSDIHVVRVALEASD